MKEILLLTASLFRNLPKWPHFQYAIALENVTIWPRYRYSSIHSKITPHPNTYSIQCYYDLLPKCNWHELSKNAEASLVGL